MKPPTCARALLLVLVAAHVAPDATATNDAHKNGQQQQQQRLGQQRQHQVQGHRGPRAARTRREQGTENPPDIGTITCSPDGNECSEVTNSECNKATFQCYCPTSYPIHDYENRYCVREAKLNTTCQFTSQCEETDPYSYCGSNKVCVCKDGFLMDDYPNVGLGCVDDGSSQSTVDPAMMGVLAGLALMFVIICVVLRLFSKARFRENRSIFNTPNPRLMNASLFKDSKLLSPARGERRGSRASVRAPSRAPSVTSVNAATRSPNGSLAKGPAVSYQRLPSLDSL
ncbi:uncharacterized protein LOC122252634 isoform X3 [Penaeus japonicus]|uniref:uncharacterized protein LOC122252634 isoform X3 n=1 Tax=Penaeus japonicus TaxID=27405 RepID=UPI001C70F8C2|nr:uncharacterized protein LOC122252634 isoform X3 [Penaeus japonicus]